MGSCQSTDIAAGAVGIPPTAKVITLAGYLREHSTPVAASDVLGGDCAADCFLCSSDRLYCGDNIPALGPEELLLPGQIYFVLPAAKLRYPLSREDMAALAVRASLALALGAERGGAKKMIRIMPAVESECGRTVGNGGEVKSSENKVGPGGGPPAVVVQKRMKRSRSVRARAAHRYYRYSRVRLSAIPELGE
ncbi:hypothetical protein Taro_022417 [Colocasia esculenta]|uniref:Uncharacterized protein n=1 Tax=Colocasia esculenta TaxID=4460 RepID=A0A843V8B2_COLES|nr:hypothetical protein [Colocasia esculenta]